MFRLYSGGNSFDNTTQFSLVPRSVDSGNSRRLTLSRTVLRPLLLSLMLILGNPLSLFATPPQVVQGGTQGFGAPGRSQISVVGVALNTEGWGFNDDSQYGAGGHNADQTHTGTIGDSGGSNGSHTAGGFGAGRVYDNNGPSNGFANVGSFDLYDNGSNTSGYGSGGNGRGLTGLQQ